MINLYNRFFEKLIFEEVGGTDTNEAKGLLLVTPIAGFEPSNGIKDSEIKLLPDALREIYTQIEFLSVLWSIYPMPEDEDIEIPEILKQDSFLKENYWNREIPWQQIHEYLRGFINIQKPDDMFNPDYCKEEHYYLTIAHHVKEENPDDYIPFDITWDLTACLKKENGKIIDNIWLVSANGRSMVNMEVSIEKYLELCYKAKGFHYWQLVYYMQDENYEYTQLMKRYLHKLFPHLELDLSDFGIK